MQLNVLFYVDVHGLVKLIFFCDGRLLKIFLELTEGSDYLRFKFIYILLLTVLRIYCNSLCPRNLLSKPAIYHCHTE